MDRVNFLVNGEPCSVGCEVSSDVSLLDYLREGSEMRGTKYMCREGGCGACVVTITRPGCPPQAVNSCLVSVTSCEGWEVCTIEGVGNRLDGYHPLQKTLAKYNGTQCGYCSPGWVMAMYSLLQSKKKLTMSEIEKSFGSNICRCTGYRPILEAFKTFASDAPQPLSLLDIEDLNICRKSGRTCRKSTCSESDWCLVEADDVPQKKEIDLKDGRSWSRVLSLHEIFDILREKGDDSYMFVAGNTAKGAYPIYEYPRVLIDISSVNELKGYQFDQNLVLGAGSTLTETMDIFEHLAATEADFWYLEKLRQHFLKVAHIPVRNIGTIGGNLMTKHQYYDFQSDVFLLFETVGAYLTILGSSGSEEKVTPVEFLKLHMRGKIILNVLLPPLGQDYKFISFKIMPRAENAHAIVNAGFLYKLDNLQTTVQEARIVYGGLSEHFVHAKETEKFLIGKKLFTNETLQAALKVLEHELVVTDNPPEPSVEYRKNLALNLFYKGLLSLCPGSIVDTRYASGGITLSSTRPVSEARQIFTTDPSLYPINEPVQKVEALIQCAGEAPFTEDLPGLPREVFGAFVLATVPLGDITSINADDALQQPGVIAFYSAKDIPGDNSFTPRVDQLVYLAEEEVFCKDSVKYNGQVIGLVVGETRHIAENAAKCVHIEYSNIMKPVIDIKEAKKDANRIKLAGEKPGGPKGTDVFKVVTGDQTIYQQTHFCMETLMCVTKPTEEGLEVHSTTQSLDNLQAVVSRVLKMPENKIDVYVRRLGGAYGVKISRANQMAAACALVTYRLNRPCRVILPLATQSNAVGKRLPCSTDYEVAIDSKGIVQYCNETVYMDNGYVLNEVIYGGTLDMYNNCYNKARWNYKVYSATTDTASNTAFRAPGTLEVIAAVEFIMERIACELSLDPLEVRLRNLDPAHSELKEMIERVKTDAQYADRRAAVDKYNAQNRWKKRGLRFSLLRWSPFGAHCFDVNLSVYHDDGTVAITHGAVDMGQGLNTRAVQIAAHMLNIPMEKIQIKGNNTISSPNSGITGGSITSNNIGLGVVRACEELLSRMAPIRAAKVGATWEELVKAAYAANVDLQTHGFLSMADMNKGDVFGVTLAEVEVDVLTGEWELIRVDLLEDVGLSVSPAIDIGQVEGAFIMGLGYWTCEQLVYDPKTGELLTDRTWNYHVPQARDIPQDFRVYFRNKSYSDPRYFGSKVVGEPPICMSVAVPFAMREAIVAARLDAGLPANQWFQIVFCYNYINSQTIQRRRARGARQTEPRQEPRLRKRQDYGFEDKLVDQIDVSSFIQKPDYDYEAYKLDNKRLQKSHNIFRAFEETYPAGLPRDRREPLPSRFQDPHALLGLRSEMAPLAPNELSYPLSPNDLSAGVAEETTLSSYQQKMLTDRQLVHNPKKKCSLTKMFPFFSHNKAVHDKKGTKKKKPCDTCSKKVKKHHEPSGSESVNLRQNKKKQERITGEARIKKRDAGRSCPKCKMKYTRRKRWELPKIIHNSRQYYAGLNNAPKETVETSTKQFDKNIRKRYDDNDVVEADSITPGQDYVSQNKQQFKMLEELERKVDSVEI